MAQNIEIRIQKLVDTFAADLTTLLRQAAADAVSEALGTTSGTKSLAKGRRGASRAAKKARAARGRARRSATGFYRRTPEELAELEGRLYREVKKKGGRRIEEIATTMGEDTRTLTLPMKKLIGAKKIKTTGQKRATRYSAA